MQARLPRFRFSLAALLLVVTIIAIAVGAYIAWQDARNRADLTSIFGGEERMAILAKPDKVEAYRLDKRDLTTSSGLLEEPRIKSGPFTVSANELAGFQRALSSRRTFFCENAPKACLPVPGVRFDFIKGNDRLQVLLCFECNILESWDNGKLVGMGDFDPGRAKLLSIVKSIFPNDPDILALRP